MYKSLPSWERKNYIQWRIQGRGPGGPPPPPAPLFLDQTEARIVSFAALLGERCVTSKKRLRARETKARRAEKKNYWRPAPPPLSKGLDDGPPPHVSQGLDPALIENVGKQIHMPNQKGKQSSKGGPMVRTLASHKCGIRIPKSRQYVG